MSKNPATQKTLMMLILLFLVLPMITSCESITKPEPKDWISGELYATLNDDVRDEALEDFFQNYTQYDLSVIFHDRFTNGFHFSFNHLLIDENEFLKIIRNDPKVSRAEFLPFAGLVSGEFYARLQFHIKDELLSEFLNIYEKYELKIIFHDKTTNRFHFSVSPDLLFKSLELLNVDQRVIWTSFDEIVPDWKKGELKVVFQYFVTDDLFDEFVLSYSKWGLKILAQVKTEFNIWSRLSFNHEMIDEFEFLEMLKQDPIVNKIDFNGPLRLWETGEIFASLWCFVQGKVLDELILSFSEYELKKIGENPGAVNDAYFSFNHKLIDEFKLMELMENDPRIEGTAFDTNRVVLP